MAQGQEANGDTLVKSIRSCTKIGMLHVLIKIASMRRF